MSAQGAARGGGQFAIRTEHSVRPGMSAAFESLQADVRRLMGAARGFGSEVLLNGLGYPGKYVSISEWESREAWQAFDRSRSFVDACKGAQTLCSGGRPDETYEVAMTIGSLPKQPGAWGQLVEWSIKSGAAEPFEASRQLLFDLRQRQGGIYVSKLYRFLGNASRYLVMQAYETRDGEKAGRGSPDIKEFFAKHPPTNYVNTTPAGEYFTVMRAG